MIVTQKKSQEEILKMLSKHSKVFFDWLRRMFHYLPYWRGKREVLEMKQCLESQGKKVTGWVHSHAPASRKLRPRPGFWAPEYAGLKGYPGYLSFVLAAWGCSQPKENDRFGLMSFPRLIYVRHPDGC